MSDEKNLNLTNTTWVWKKYPVGKYSGNTRLDPSEQKEREIDNEFTRKLWLEEMVDDEDFIEHVKEKIEQYKQIIGLTADPEKMEVLIAGQSHIDMAWLWRYEQTRQKGALTFKKAILHSKLFPGNFVYCASEPILFDWFKEDDPSGFEELREYVKKGSIELVGGSYVEPDCMMPSGEAFVRSRLYGMKFYKENFGILPKVEWFLDSFGYNYGLPQILKKSGAEYFWTSKITWNRQTIFPFVNFLWESPDGTRLLTSNFKQNWSVLDSWMQFELGRHLLREGGMKVWNYYRKDYEDLDEDMDEDEIIPHVAVFAGKGDGGHGPTHEEVAFDQMMVKMGFAKWGKAEEYFKKIEKYTDRLPVWADELYLEYHRGTFSVHWEVKRHNRLFEHKFTSFENLGVLLSLVNPSYVYPLKEMEAVWKVLLLNQFHDVLPGSSIPEVYDDVYAMWLETHNVLNKIVEDWIAAVPVPEGAEITLNNPLSWKRTSPVFVPFDELKKIKEISLDDNGKPPYIRLIDLNGDEKLIGQPIAAEEGEERDPNDRRPAGWYVIAELEPFSIKAYKVEVLNENNDVNGDIPFKIEEKDGNVSVISNGTITVELDPSNGAILALKCGEINGGNNLLKGSESNLTFGFLDDYPTDHAWNIKPEYWKYPLDIPNDKNVSINLKENGPVFATVEIRKILGEGDPKPKLEGGSTIGASEVVQTITLFKNDPTIYLSYSSDWKQPYVMLKVAYETATDAEWDVSDQCYCAIKRSTRPKTRPDKARYEKIMHNYVDLSTPNNSWGIALLNEGKYAYDASEGRLRLTMLRTPVYPRPAAESWVHKERARRKEKDGTRPPKFIDVGFLRCRYALLPHNGGALENPDGSPNAIVKKSAEEFNCPVIVKTVPKDVKGSADNDLSKMITEGTGLLNVNYENIQISSLKPKEWESSGGIIMRVVEVCGVDTKGVRITFNKPIGDKIKGVIPVDLLERPIEDGSAAWNKDENSLTLDIGKFEIKSFELKLQ